MVIDTQHMDEWPGFIHGAKKMCLRVVEKDIVRKKAP